MTDRSDAEWLRDFDARNETVTEADVARADHSVFTRPECRCARCMGVYDEWAAQAEGFQRWFDGQSDAQMLDNFRLVRAKAAR